VPQTKELVVVALPAMLFVGVHLDDSHRAGRLGERPCHPRPIESRRSVTIFISPLAMSMRRNRATPRALS
jgi:hypothetical protein